MRSLRRGVWEGRRQTVVVVSQNKVRRPEFLSFPRQVRNCSLNHAEPHNIMVVLSTSEEWQRQSSLLLQARPTSVRDLGFLLSKSKLMRADPDHNEVQHPEPRVSEIQQL